MVMVVFGNKLHQSSTQDLFCIKALHEIGDEKSRLGGQMWTFNQRKNDKVSVGSFACLRNDPAFMIISVGI